MDEIITMADMGFVYEVTDEFDIDREALTVELTKEDPGLVQRGASGKLEIVLPLNTPMEEWQATLKTELVRLGY